MSRTLNALADPTRRGLLLHLARGEATVTDLVRPFALTQPAISQHLKVLEDAGLIATRQDGVRRPRRLTPGGLHEMEAWMAMLHRSFEKNYSRLDHVLDGMKKKKGKKS